MRFTIEMWLSFYYSTYRYHAQIAHIDNKTGANNSVAYVIILPFLERLFNVTEVLQNHTDLLNFNPKVLKSNLSIQEDAYSRELGLLQTTLLDMNTVVNASLNDSKIFTAISQQIVQDIQQLSIDFGDLPFIKK